MRTFRWGLIIAVAAAMMTADLLSTSNRLWLLIVVLLAFGTDRANVAEAALVAKYRGWKERRERQRHTEVRGDIAGTRSDIALVGAKVDRLVASISREAETAVAREDTEEAKAARRAEYERIMEAFHEIIALYDKAMEYGEMSTDTLRDIGKIIAGSAAEANEVETLLGLPLTVDREHHERMSAHSKLEQIWLRIHLYHKERVGEIAKDKELFPGVTQALQSGSSSEVLPPHESSEIT